MKTVSDTIWRAPILMEKPQTLDSIQEDNHVNIYIPAGLWFRLRLLHTRVCCG